MKTITLTPESEGRPLTSDDVQEGDTSLRVILPGDGFTYNWPIVRDEQYNGGWSSGYLSGRAIDEIGIQIIGITRTIPDVPEQVELPSEPGAILDGLLWAMLGNTDGELIDANSEIPAGEMYRLAVEFLKPVLARLVPAGSEREAALREAIEWFKSVTIGGNAIWYPMTEAAFVAHFALVPEAEGEKA